MRFWRSLTPAPRTVILFLGRSNKWVFSQAPSLPVPYDLRGGSVQTRFRSHQGWVIELLAARTSVGLVVVRSLVLLAAACGVGARLVAAPAGAAATRPAGDVAGGKGQSAKPKLAVAPFIHLGELPAGLTHKDSGAIFANRLFDSIETGDYVLVDRLHVAEVLDEQEFQRTADLADQKALAAHAKAGKLAGADYLVVGRVEGLGGAYNVAARIINCESGEASAWGSEEFDDPKAFGPAVRALAVKLKLRPADPVAPPTTPADPARSVRELLAVAQANDSRATARAAMTALDALLIMAPTHPDGLALRREAAAHLAADWLAGAAGAAARVEDGETRTTAYRDVAGVLARAGDVDGALALADKIEDAEKRAATYRDVAAARAAAGDARAARATADRITLPDYKARADRDLAAAEAKAGHVADAEAMAAVIPDGKWKSSAHAAVAAAQAQAGNVAAAKAAAAKTTFDTDKAAAYRSIAKAEAKAGDGAAARETFHLAVEAAERVPDFWAGEGGASLRETAAAQAETGDLAGAQATAERIKDDVERAVAYGALASAQSKAGDAAGAAESREKAALATKMVGFSQWGDPVRDLNLQRLAKVQAAAGDTAEAERTAKTISVFDALSHSRASAYAAIAAARARAGDRRGAISAAVLTFDVKQRAVSFRAVAMAQVKTGHWQGADKWAEQLQDSTVKAYVFLGAAEGLLPEKP